MIKMKRNYPVSAGVSPLKRVRSGFLRAGGVIVLYGVLLLAVCYFYWHGDVRPIPRGPASMFLSSFRGKPALSVPLEPQSIPQHPFMAPNGRNNMHSNSYLTGTYPFEGPLGNELKKVSATLGVVGGMAASVLFDRKGRIVTVSGRFSGFRLLVLHPRTLRVLASYPLPQRPGHGLSIRKMVHDTSGGAYFYLDHEDRAILATADRKIQVIRQVEGKEGLSLQLERSFDLNPALRLQGHPHDRITTALPDWQGRYWFISRHGLVGTVHPGTGAVSVMKLPGEEIQNSFAIGREAVYIVSDHALYRFEADRSTGVPRVIWRELYDRGSRKKPGMINQGSGISPTLMEEKYVAIADNADPRMHVLVYHRGKMGPGKQLHSKIPVFQEGRSASDNSFIAYKNSLIIENNYGYDIFPTMMFGRTSEPGIARIDIRPDGTCFQVWQSREISQTTVPKLSIANGLIYLYTKDPDMPRGLDAYYFTAIDFRSGRTIYKFLTGTGVLYDNCWAPITLGPDGTAYMGTVNGLVALRDSSRADSGLWWRLKRQSYFFPLIFAMVLTIVILINRSRIKLLYPRWLAPKAE